MDKEKCTSPPRFRLYPTEQQRKQIDVTLDAVRFTYNHFLAMGKLQYRESGSFPGRFEMQGQLPVLKQEIPWLAQADSVALQIVVQHLSWTFQHFMKRKAEGLKTRLHFKSWHGYTQSYRRVNGHNHVAIVGNKLKISKVGLVKMKLSKPITGRIIAATITRVGTDEYAKYYVSFYYEPDPAIALLPPTGKAVGVDLGLKTFATTSDGDKIAMEDFFEKHKAHMDELYAQLRRQTPGSRRWETTYNQIKRIKEQVCNCRTDFFHKTAYELVHNYDIICVETLNTRSMLLKDETMKYKIWSAAFSEFVEILGKKCEQHGRRLVKIPRFYPSTQLCSNCGHQYRAAHDLDVRTWVCPVCGAVHDRDINAAINILNEGLRLLQLEEAA